MSAKRNKIFFDKIDQIELELLRQSDEYTKQFLGDEGFDVNKETEFAQTFMKKVRFLAAANSNKEQDRNKFEIAYERIKKAMHDNVEKTKETLISLLQSKTPSVQYRKLENWTDDEIRDVLADVDLVKLMEELDKEG